MPTTIKKILLLCFIGLPVLAHAARMRGKVYDVSSHHAMPDVDVYNIYTEQHVTTDSNGLFQIEVSKGQLVEFSTLGYDIQRVRITGDPIPTFYNIAMKEGAILLDEVNIVDLGRGKWESDSAHMAETYKIQLQHYKLQGMDVIQHPFDALSKQNRKIWAFQKEYEYFEKEKYIDYTFNANIIKQLTGLSKDSVHVFMRQYRPDYNMIRSMSVYDFYDYIKRSAAEFRRRQRAQSAINE